MKRTVILLHVILVLVASCVGVDRVPDAKPDEFKSAVTAVTVLQDLGGRTGWSHTHNVIAFDRKGDDGYFDIWVTHIDGAGLHCLTCDAGVPHLHNGNPAWHPSGTYIVFQSQDPHLEELSAVGGLEKYIASPGVGINNNIWIMTSDGTKFWQLTHVKDRHGGLHPHFSPDGTMLLWSEIISPRMDRIGHWAIKLADFTIEDSTPYLNNIQTLQPDNLQLYEVHGFSPDGQRIIFSGVEEGKYYYDMEIYIMDLTTGETVKLTDNTEWDEHAHFTPDGHHIVWVSSQGIPQLKGDSLEDIAANPPKLEYWIMNADGSGKRRLSGFNHPGVPEYIDTEGGIGLGDFDMGPDGTTIVAKMRRGQKEELTVFIEFNLEENFKYHCCFILCSTLFIRI